MRLACTMSDYYTILVNLGYKLHNRGDYWQTAAVFRHGDNPTALKIYKNSGVWIDFVDGDGKAQSFKKLLQKTTGKEDVSQFELEQLRYERRQFLSEEKTFPDDCLGRLLPDYDFFLHKEKDASITAATQKAYSAGVATKGSLYNRVVFPIRNKDGKIHGFSGRDITGRSRIKWLHNGKANNWLYPYYTVNECRESIRERGYLILVESIGDSMALYQAGFPNNIVAFTNSISPRLVARLAALNVDVVVAFNNDHQKPLAQNEGVKGGINSLLKLFQLIDFKKLWFMPPVKHVDFGEMKGNKITDHFRVTYDEEEHKKQIALLLRGTQTITPMKTLLPTLSKLKKEYHFHYDD